MGLVHALLLTVAQLTCYVPPVDAPVAEPFVAPACPYCPGHRGVEYVVAAGTPVRAAASGEVTFDGVVAGSRYLVVNNDDGLTATYGILASSAVTVGARVQAGQILAHAGARLYFGLRMGDVYVDPQDYLAVVHWRPRLVPSSGLPGRPARPMPPSCPRLSAGGSGPVALLPAW